MSNQAIKYKVVDFEELKVEYEGQIYEAFGRVVGYPDGEIEETVIDSVYDEDANNIKRKDIPQGLLDDIEEAAQDKWANEYYDSH